MAGEPPFYAEIDGAWHTIGEGEVTLCGLRLPYPGAVWTKDMPDKLHCGKDDPLVQVQMEVVEPEPTPSKAKAKK